MSNSLINLAKTEKLFEAIKDRDFNKAEKLLEDGANPNRLLLNGITPLHLAIAGESTFSYDYVKLLLKFKGNPNVRDADGLTPLHIAAQWDKADCLSLLLKSGANLFILDKDGNDILWHAENSKHCRMIINEYLNASTDCQDADFASASSSFTKSSLLHKIDDKSDIIPLQELNNSKTLNDSNFFLNNSNHWQDKHSATPEIASFQKSARKCSVEDYSNDKENPFFFCEPTKKLTLDATSPDHCFFVYKSKKRDKLLSIQDTLIKPTDDPKLLLKDSLALSPSSVYPLLEVISGKTSESLSSKSTGYSVEHSTPSSTTVSGLDTSQSSSSICTFADSTVSVNDTCTDINLQNYSSSIINTESLQPSDMSDSLCQKMLLHTRYAEHLQEDNITPKTSMSYHSPKKLFIGSDDGHQGNEDSIASHQTSCNKEKNAFAVLPKNDSDSCCEKLCSSSIKELTITSNSDEMSKSEASMLKPHSSADYKNDRSLSPESLKDVCNAFDSLTMADISGSSPPIKLYLSTSSLPDVTDNTILYDWQALEGSDSFEQLGSSIVDIQSLPADIENMDDKKLRTELIKHGVSPGPIHCARTQYKKQLYLLGQGHKLPTVTISGSCFSRELESVIRGNSLPSSVVDDDTDLRSEFDDPSQSTRGGYVKDSFNYLLLDPRITKNLPERSKSLSESEALKIFAGATFYVGKGKKSRPYAHLKEALRNSKNTKNRKIEHINDIWRTDGVVSLHVFQNVLACEAFTREAAMIEAFGLDHLTNCVRGKAYGAAQSWDTVRLRHYGAFLIIRSMQMLLLEGERQIRPHQISNRQRCKNS